MDGDSEPMNKEEIYQEILKLEDEVGRFNMGDLFISKNMDGIKIRLAKIQAYCNVLRIPYNSRKYAQYLPNDT